MLGIHWLVFYENPLSFFITFCFGVQQKRKGSRKKKKTKNNQDTEHMNRIELKYSLEQHQIFFFTLIVLMRSLNKLAELRIRFV